MSLKETVAGNWPRYRQKLLGTAIARVLLVSLALAALLLYSQLDPPTEVDQLQIWQYRLIGVAYFLSLVYLSLIRVDRLILPLVYTEVLLDAMLVTVLVLMTGGLMSVFSFGYVFCILVGSTLMQRWGALFGWLTSLIAFGAILVLQLSNTLSVLPHIEAVPAMMSYGFHVAGMGLVAVLAGTLTRNLWRTGEDLAQKTRDLDLLQELHAAILHSLPSGLMTIQHDGTIVYANPSAAQILRQPLDALVGSRLCERVSALCEAWVAQSEGRGLGQRTDVSLLRADGSRIRLGFAFAPLHLTEAPSATIAIFQDVTEVVRLKAAVERAERLATVGKFAAGLAHEVRNPLSSICASIEVIQGSLDPPPAMARLMNNAIVEADRMNALITDFLTLTRPRRMQVSRIDLGKLVEEVLSMFKLNLPDQGIEVVAKLGDGFEVSGDESMLRQVLWNLLRNAAEAMSQDGGHLWVELEHLPSAEVRLTLRDEGGGIPESVMNRVFDPFYTTKEHGTGLGLAISHSILEAHEAKLHMESVEGEGTTLCLIFPPALSGDIKPSISPALAPEA